MIVQKLLRLDIAIDIIIDYENIINIVNKVANDFPFIDVNSE